VEITQEVITKIFRLLPISFSRLLFPPRAIGILVAKGEDVAASI
jgi:hypothetical protein